MISIVITAYNAEKYIAQAITSILTQSHDDLECIVVDDGSTDRTLAIVRSFADPRMRIIEAGRVGRGRALNIGWRAANGEYVAIQDADDVSHPDRFGVQAAILDDIKDKSTKIGAPLAILGSTQLLMHRDCGISWIMEPEIYEIDHANNRLVFRNPLSHTSLMIRKNVLEAIGGYDESRHDLFDWDLLIRVSMRELFIGLMKYPFIAHRIHPDQFFEARKRIRYAWHCAQMQWRAIRALERNLLWAFTIPPLFLYRIRPRVLR